jgi:hypothetical protein
MKHPELKLGPASGRLPPQALALIYELTAQEWDVAKASDRLDGGQVFPLPVLRLAGMLGGEGR